jgi:MFS family permease
VGGVEYQNWLLASLTTTFVIFSPPVSQAADYFGRRWLLIGLAGIGCIGAIIVSRATSVSSNTPGTLCECLF